MLIELKQFSGLMPKIDPHLLPDNQAVVAQNCKIISGNIKPWNNPLTVNTPTRGGTIESLFLYDNLFLTWNAIVNAAKSPLSNDTFGRLYWSGSGVPQYASKTMIETGGTNYPNASYDLGVPAPTSQLTAALGADWSNETLPASGTWAVTFGNGIFVAVLYGTSKGATSTDGVTWTQRNLGTSGSWFAITYGNGVFVAVETGSQTTITSTDGITWTAHATALPSASYWTSLAYGNGVFVAFILASASYATSPDGITWTGRTLPTGYIGEAVCFGATSTGVAAGSGLFVLAPGNNLNTVLTSSDGVTWTVGNLPQPLSGSALCITYGNGTFVMVGADSNVALTSTDGIIWEGSSLPSVQYWVSVAYGNGTFIALANESAALGNTTVSASSVDNGKTWTTRTLATSQKWWSIAFSPSSLCFVAMPYNSAVANLLTNIDQTTLETRNYVFRFVSSMGEPGPPSDPMAASIDVWPGQSVTVSGTYTAPSGDRNITLIEIYRTNSGSTAAAYQYVDQIAAPANGSPFTYTDTIADAALGEVLDSLYYDPPPTDLLGLVVLNNGSLCGYSPTAGVCFSVPYLPHAWPTTQQYPLADPCMGVASFGNTVLATTQGRPYNIDIGSDLTALLPYRLEDGYACVSTQGIVDMAGSAAYPSTNGLMFAGVSGVSLITSTIMDKDAWQALNPSSIMAFYYGGMYLAFTNIGCFMLNPTSSFNQLGAAIAGLDMATLNSLSPTAGFHDPATGNLYLMVGANIVQWDAGATKMTYTWQSKPFVAPKPVNMSCAQVFADSYPVTLEQIVDGTVVSTSTVADNTPFRLPGPSTGVDKGTEFVVSISGSSTVYRAFMATSMEELRKAA